MSGNQRRFHLRHLENEPHAVYVIWNESVPRVRSLPPPSGTGPVTCPTQAGWPAPREEITGHHELGVIMPDTNRCNGLKADGARCGATRMTNWAGHASHLVTPEPWFCHRHKDQPARICPECLEPMAPSTDSGHYVCSACRAADRAEQDAILAGIDRIDVRTVTIAVPA